MEFPKKVFHGNSGKTVLHGMSLIRQVTWAKNFLIKLRVRLSIEVDLLII